DIHDCIGMSNAIRKQLTATTNTNVYVVVQDDVSVSGPPPNLRTLREGSRWLSHRKLAGIVAVKNPHPLGRLIQTFLMVASGYSHWHVDTSDEAIGQVQALLPDLRDTSPDTEVFA
ncbi:MAG: hypothetical protein AAF125_25235, partial [Chloroflexota bacterium]